jgi:hypothetical protein
MVRHSHLFIYFYLNVAVRHSMRVAIAICYYCVVLPLQCGQHIQSDVMVTYEGHSTTVSISQQSVNCSQSEWMDDDRLLLLPKMSTVTRPGTRISEQAGNKRHTHTLTFSCTNISCCACERPAVSCPVLFLLFFFFCDQVNKFKGRFVCLSIPYSSLHLINCAASLGGRERDKKKRAHGTDGR